MHNLIRNNLKEGGYIFILLFCCALLSCGEEKCPTLYQVNTSIDSIWNPFLNQPVDTVKHSYYIEILKNEGKENQCVMFNQTITYTFYRSLTLLSDELDPTIMGLVEGDFMEKRPDIQRYLEQWSIGEVDITYNAPNSINVFNFYDTNLHHRDEYEEELIFSSDFEIILTDSLGHYHKNVTTQEGVRLGSSYSRGGNYQIHIKHTWINQDGYLYGRNRNNNGFRTIWDKEYLNHVFHTEDSLSIHISDTLLMEVDNMYSPILN
jgi:hypothetical protein